MDEKSIKITWTPEGVAGIWLVANMPSASKETQIALGKLLQDTWYSAVREALKGVIGEVNDCPTVSAVQAKMEAMLDEVKQVERVQNRHDKAMEFDPDLPF
jgi:hypothetical protein